MAGLAGIVYPDIFQTGNLLKGMLQVLSHRYEASPQEHRHNNLEMGILGGDLSSNHQQSIVVMIDGTIVNASEIFKEIQDVGIKPKNYSQASLIIHAYEMWGLDFVQKLNGNFAIALFDHLKKSLFLFRDRMGKRPLYWARKRGHFIFSSELKGILSTGVIPQTPANDALASYLFLGYIPQDITPIQDVNKLLPGYYLHYSLDKRINVEAFWSYSSFFSKKTLDSEGEIRANLDHLLKDSVLKQLPENKKSLGCILGGGLGSASIAYYLSAAVGKENTHAYSAYFEGQNEGDFKAAQSVAQSLQIDHQHSCINKKNFVEDLIPIIWYLDEPIADPNVVATWKQCELASHHNRTIFSGMGSDELLGGHQRYHLKETHLTLHKLINLLPNSFMRRFILPILKQVSPRQAYSILRSFHTDPKKQQFLTEHAIFEEKALKNLSPLLSKHFNSNVFLQKFYQLVGLNRDLEAFLYFDVKTALADKYSLQFERLTAAHQLDWRTPFFDHRIVEYLASVPEKYNFKENNSGNLLKVLMLDRLPKKLIQRPKTTRQKFLAPWISSPQLNELFMTLDKGILVESGYLSPKIIQNLIKAPHKQKYPLLSLWSILNLELWFQLFINRPVTSFPKNLTTYELLSGCREEMRGFSAL